MEQKKHKILFLSSWNESSQRPTHGIFVKHHAEAVSLHCDVAFLQVISELHQKGSYKITSQKNTTGRQINISYKKSTTIPLFSKMINGYRYFNSYKKGVALVKQEWGTPDIIHANVILPVGIVALFQKIKNKTPYILTEHWTGYLPADGNYKGFLKKWWTKKTVKNADYITCVSKDLLIAMQSHGLENKYEVIPNVVDTTVFYPQDKKSVHTKKQIVHVSALDDTQKNISGILRTLKKISETRIDFELTIIGDGPSRKELEALAEKTWYIKYFCFFQRNET